MKANIRLVLFWFVLFPLFFGEAQAQQVQVMVGAPGIFPRWADGGGYRVAIDLVNTGAKPVTAQLRFVLVSGTAPEFFKVSVTGDDQVERFQDVVNGIVSISINKSVEVRTLGQSPGVVAGWIEFKAPSEKVTGLLSFYYPHGSAGEELSTTVAVEPLRRGHAFFVDYKGSGSRFSQSTGMAIVNPDSISSATVKVTAADRAGSQVSAAPKEFVLGPGESVAKFVHELFPELVSRQEFHGTVNVYSDQPTVAMGIRYFIEANDQFHIDNFPSMPNVASKAVLRSICFYPVDIPVDPDCQKGFGVVSQGVRMYWDRQMFLNNQRSLSGDIPVLHDFVTGQIYVEVIRGKYGTDYYSTSLSKGWVEVVSEIREIYPDDYLVISSHIRDRWDAYGGGRMAFFHGPDYRWGLTWKDFVDPEKFLKTADRKSGKYETWMHEFNMVAHESGHMVGLLHSLALEQQYPGKENIMRGAMPPPTIVLSHYETDAGMVDQVFPKHAISMGVETDVDSWETDAVLAYLPF